MTLGWIGSACSRSGISGVARRNPCSSFFHSYSTKPLQSLRGMHDYMHPTSTLRSHVLDAARSSAVISGYNEPTALFARSLGEASDVVSKEMYTFDDRSGDSVTLRPEATAGVMRAVGNHALHHKMPQRYYYEGPMFRYERPQKGRFREFYQAGIEMIGCDHPHADVEVIGVAWQFLTALGLTEKKNQQLVIELNSLGSTKDREIYRNVLAKYLSEHLDSLSQDSKNRMERGSVLRVLDSKDKGDRDIISNAPSMDMHMSTSSRHRFDQVQDTLNKLGIPFTVNPHLVRGLDYYTHTAFEIVSAGLGKTQGTVLAGGRYDGLSKSIGCKKDVSGVGWACGVDRLMLLLDEKELESAQKENLVYVVSVREADGKSEMVDAAAMNTCQILRNWCAQSGMKKRTQIMYHFDGNVSKQMKRANAAGARFTVVIGEEEAQQGTATVKDMLHGTQKLYPIDSLKDVLCIV